MDVKKLVLLIGALIVAVVTAVGARKMFSGAGAPAAVAAPVATGPEILVAAKPLHVGTIIDAEALRYQRWPEGLVQSAYYIKGKPGVNTQALIGTVVRNEITVGQPLTQGSVIKPGERGYLAAALGPGMRAVTVAVSATSGVAGFIFPGDRVDLVLTQEVHGGDGPPLKASETIIRNIRVLATDQRMSAQGADGKPVIERFSSVTFEATPKIAEKIQVAQTIGQLSLSLRSLADNSVDLQKALAAGEVTTTKPGDPKAPPRVLVPVASQPIDTGTTFTVGAEVSRFQRSTAPQKPKPQPNPYAQVRYTPWGQPIDPNATGPVVRVARGNHVTTVPVGAK